MSFGKSALTSYMRRNAASLALSVIVFCVLAIFALLILTIGRLNQQVASQNEALDQLRGITATISRNAEQRTVQIAGIDRHLDCIVQFFSQRDRTSKSIEDIETCRIDGTASSSEPRTSPRTSSTVQTSTTSGSSAEGQPQGSSEAQTAPPANKPNIIQRVVNPIVQLIQGGL